MALELPDGVKVLNPNPIDPRMVDSDLLNPNNEKKYDPTLYIGYFPIYDITTGSQYMVTGGNKDVGWTFTLFSGTRLDQTLPEVMISSNTESIIEVGSLINPTLTFTYKQNDGGLLVELRIYKNDILIHTQNNTNSFQDTTPYTVNNEEYVYSIEVDYDNSKNVPEGTINNKLVISGQYKNYAGNSDNNWSNTDIKSLDYSYGELLKLSTGNTHTNFIAAVPSNVYTVKRITDGESGGFNILSEYTINNKQLTDAGGNLVNYNVYELQTTIPYSEDHNHILILEKI